ncbi:hypothetical protein [Parafilimonas sp.]|uniref:hypothetical protein n=1 Tax=Parafilimonas sp. TaxID=1969739 RepID=UPI0039E408DE
MSYFVYDYIRSVKSIAIHYLRNIPLFVAVALFAAMLFLIAFTSKNQGLQSSSPVIKTGGSGLKIKVKDSKENLILRRFISSVEVEQYLY